MRILLADTQAKVRFALRVLLERQAGLQVIGEVMNPEELLACTAVECPDVVLLDWELAGPAAPSLLRTLRSDCSEMAVIALSGRLEARRAALAAGADAFVSKGDPPERLLEAIALCRRSEADKVPLREVDAIPYNAGSEAAR
jgi:DNA-binding NarL/FixJ family response regulator